jgi:hypothetical protein
MKTVAAYGEGLIETDKVLLLRASPEKAVHFPMRD